MRLLGRRPENIVIVIRGGGSTADNALREGLSFRSSLIEVRQPWWRFINLNAWRELIRSMERVVNAGAYEAIIRVR